MPTVAQQRKTVVMGDVLSFAQVGLGLELYDWQLKANMVIDQAAKYERIKIAVAAPNGSGKTQRIVAVSALRWLNQHPRGRVIITSSDGKQLDSQLMPVINSYRGRFPNWEFLQRGIRTPAGGFLLAFTTDEPSRAEGHHKTDQSPLLIMVDESKSIPAEIFQAFDRCSYNAICYISSPGIKAGVFYEAFTLNREQFILVTQVGLADCPHISQERIDDVISTYGENKPFTRSTLYGEFMDQDESQLMAFSYENVMKAIRNPPGAKISRHEYCAFCDFAAGRDENVIAIRSGNKLLDLVAWRERDTVAATGRFIIEFRKHDLRAEMIWGDNGGVGHAFVDMLSAAGWPINRFDFGATAQNDNVYVSRGAEIWDQVSQRANRHELVLLDDPLLISQLTTRKILLDPRGRIKLQSKEDMLREGMKSPDRADAMIGAFSHGAQTFASYAKRTGTPWDQLDEHYDKLIDEEVVFSERDDSSTSIRKSLGAWTGD